MACYILMNDLYCQQPFFQRLLCVCVCVCVCVFAQHVRLTRKCHKVHRPQIEPWYLQAKVCARSTG